MSVRTDLLDLLAVVRVATAAQARALVTPNAVSSGYVRRGLRALAAEGLVDGTPVGLNHEVVWYLTVAGLRALAECGSRPPRRRAVGPAMVRSGLLRHAVAVTATIAAFTAAGAGRPASWTLERVHRYGQGEDQRLITDAVLAVRPPAGESFPPVLLVEVDRATLPLSRLAGELGAYAAYANVPGRRDAAGRTRTPPRWQRDYPGLTRFPPVLFVLDGAAPPTLARRAARLAEVAAAEGWTSVLDVGTVPLLTLAQQGPTAPVVTPLDAPDRRVGVHHLARSPQ
jgi:hypothetical protein